MKARHRRFALVGAAGLALGLAAWLLIASFERNLVFFFTPAQVAAGEAPAARAFRVGGLVEAQSLAREPDGLTVRFIVSDGLARLPVRYVGVLPDLFRENKGVVVQGRLDGGGGFVAQEVLAKHDENYMPPEAAHALEQAAERGRPR